MIGLHCDGPECDSWAFQEMTDGWLTVLYSRPILNPQEAQHFCCRDCCGKFMILNSVPSETV